MAEEALHAGKWLQARSRASEVLAQQGAALADVTRAFYVLLQVDFHAGRCVMRRREWFITCSGVCACARMALGALPRLRVNCLQLPTSLVTVRCGYEPFPG
jgi:hypothetical protein